MNKQCSKHEQQRIIQDGRLFFEDGRYQGLSEFIGDIVAPDWEPEW